jgi:thiol-disulfide isomerase/thioredoxin
MKIVYRVFHFLKPMLLLALIVGALHITGQLSNVATYGQTAMLKTGLFNAGAELEPEEAFDFNFKATTPAGAPLSMDSLANKVIFLNLWATWCGPCRAEMPTIQTLYSSIDRSNIAFVMLSIDKKGSEKKVTDYIAKNRYTFPVYILNGAPSEQLRVPSIPTTFIISKDGKVVRKEVGMTNFNTEKFKKFLLKEASK